MKKQQATTTMQCPLFFSMESFKVQAPSIEVPSLFRSFGGKNAKLPRPSVAAMFVIKWPINYVNIIMQFLYNGISKDINPMA